MSNAPYDQDPALDQGATGNAAGQQAPPPPGPDAAGPQPGDRQSGDPHQTESRAWPPETDRYLREDRSRWRKESGLPYKSPALAAVLSIMPGLGQVYVGYYQHGFQYLLLTAVLIGVQNTSPPEYLAAMCGIFMAFFWIFQMIDAHRRAHHYNRALDGLTTDAVPDDFEMPGVKGSMPVGIVLIVVGVLVLLDLNTNISLEWLENWWPAGLIAAGVWLVLRARRQAR